jgi:hypothetical protein
MTYKDFVLYDDFRNQDCWFPIGNLMTHGVIKGNLERLGGADDPIDKFTNDAVFYVARGISMIELYISPDLLTEGEWNAIGGAIRWARDRSDVLANTHMTGGDPTNREAYGYLHFKGQKGILALRNPYITPTHLVVHLDNEYGLDPKASNLVLEKVYPYRWISPSLYACGSTIDIPLEGYETAVFEIYPLQEATEPLICGARFDVLKNTDKQYSFSVYDAPLGIRLLNPSTVSAASLDGVKVNPELIPVSSVSGNVAVRTGSIETQSIKTGAEWTQKITADPSVTEIRYAVLLKPDPGFEDKEFPVVSFRINDKEETAIKEEQKGLWVWNSVKAGKDCTAIRTRMQNAPKTKEWKGTVLVYVIASQKQAGKMLELTTRNSAADRPMPPLPFEKGVSEKISKAGDFPVFLK